MMVPCVTATSHQQLPCSTLFTQASRASRISQESWKRPAETWGCKTCRWLCSPLLVLVAINQWIWGVWNIRLQKVTLWPHYSVDSLPAKGVWWSPLCAPQNAAQVELVEAAGHISNVIFSIAADGAAPLCFYSHVCFLQQGSERLRPGAAPPCWHHTLLKRQRLWSLAAPWMGGRNAQTPQEGHPPRLPKPRHTTMATPGRNISPHTSPLLLQACPTVPSYLNKAGLGKCDGSGTGTKIYQWQHQSTPQHQDKRWSYLQTS